MLDEFGSIAAFSHASEERLRDALQRSPGAADALLASRQILLAGIYERVIRSPLDPTSPKLHQYLFHKLGHLKTELIMAMFADEDGNFIAEEILAHGETGAVRVSARYILRRALHHDACSMLLIHNHPSGVSEPSRDDIFETRRIEELGFNLGIKLCDHLVIARDGVFSMQKGALYAAG